MKRRSCKCYPFDIKHLPPTMIPSVSQKVNVFSKPAVEAPAPSFGSVSAKPCEGAAFVCKLKDLPRIPSLPVRPLCSGIDKVCVRPVVGL